MFTQQNMKTSGTVAVVICGAGNIHTRRRARNFDTQCGESADNYMKLIFVLYSCRVFSKFHARACMYFILSTNLHRQDQRLFDYLFLRIENPRSKNRQKVKTAVEVSGVSDQLLHFCERELNIDIWISCTHFRTTTFPSSCT